MARTGPHPAQTQLDRPGQRWRGTSALATAALSMGLLTASQAGPKAAAEAAWGCIKANGEAMVQGATTGVKVLEFIATKPMCVAQLVTPPPAIPQVAMGVTVGIATQQKLTSYDSCSDRIYGFVANPVLGAVKGALDQAPSLPPPLNSLKAGLSHLAADNAVELLTSVPGTEVVTGGIDCGCALVDAGLQPQTVVQIYNSSKKVVQQCANALEELGPLGTSLVAVGGAVSTGWRDTVNDPQHMPYQQYFDRFWAPQVEGLAQKLIQPGSQDWTPTVKPLWDNCVKYFDGHNQYQKTAQVTCDDMRDGTGSFPRKGFVQAINARTWTLMVPAAVENYARYLAQQQTEYARSARLGNAVQQALREAIFADFGLSQVGTALRDGEGNPQWVGANTLGERAMRQMPTAVRGSSVLDARAAANKSVIAGTYNGSDLLTKVLRWQAAYPALSAAQCATPPGIRVQTSVPGIRRRERALPTASIACNDHSVPAATLARAVDACQQMATDLSGQVRLDCPEAATIETPSIRRQPPVAPIAVPSEVPPPAVRPRPPLRVRSAG